MFPLRIHSAMLAADAAVIRILEGPRRKAPHFQYPPAILQVMLMHHLTEHRDVSPQRLLKVIIGHFIAPG